MICSCNQYEDSSWVLLCLACMQPTWHFFATDNISSTSPRSFFSGPSLRWSSLSRPSSGAMRFLLIAINRSLHRGHEFSVCDHLTMHGKQNLGAACGCISSCVPTAVSSKPFNKLALQEVITPPVGTRAKFSNLLKPLIQADAAGDHASWCIQLLLSFFTEHAC